MDSQNATTWPPLIKGALMCAGPRLGPGLPGRGASGQSLAQGLPSVWGAPACTGAALHLWQ
eukprot:15450444-Alexandrium_andersonii.AAC.1